MEVSDEEADPGQALPHEELELTETNTAAQGAVPEPKYPPKGVYKPPPLVLRPKLKANPPEPMPAEAKPSGGGHIALRGIYNAGNFAYDSRGCF